MAKDIFKFFNPNPAFKPAKEGKKEKIWKAGDCTTRAICAATGKNWTDVFKKQMEIALEKFDMPNNSPVVQATLERMGFVKHSYKRGQKRETVKAFCETHKRGIYILNLAGHVTCVKNGKLYDVWDCSYMTAYNYYEFLK